MRFLWSSALKDLRWRLADPSALLIWIGIPLVLGTLLGLIGGGGGAQPTARVLLVDQDDTFLSNLLANAQPLGEEGLLEVERVDLEQGRAGIEAGEATALLIIPPGFSEGVLEEKPTRLTLITNPAQRILPKIVEEFLDILLEATFYLQRMFGDVLRRFAEGPPEGQSTFSDEAIAAISIEINQRMSRLNGTLFPPVLQLESEVEETESVSEHGFGLLFLPGIVFMSLIFISQGVSEDIWKERDQGTLRRIVSAPQPLLAFVGGKLVAGAVLMLVVSLTGLVIGAVAFDLAVGRLPLALVWCTYTGTALLTYFLLIQTFATSERGGMLLTTMILFPLIMVGGSFFPFEMMPAWMASIGQWTPNGLAVTRLKQMLVSEVGVRPLLSAAVGIGIPAAAAVWLLVRRMRGRFLVG